MVAVTAPEVPLSAAFHIWVIALPEGSVHETFQPEIAALPELVTVTSDWKPPGHELTVVYVAVHPWPVLPPVEPDVVPVVVPDVVPVVVPDVVPPVEPDVVPEVVPVVVPEVVPDVVPEEVPEDVPAEELPVLSRPKKWMA